MASGDAAEISRPRGRPRIAETQAITAAIELLESLPARAITMELIAERSGISKVTLYRRWPTKLALFVEAMLARFVEIMPLDETLPPATALRRHVVAMADAFSGPTGGLVRNVVGESLADPEMAGLLRDRYLGARRARAIRIIQRGLAEGTFAAREPAERLHDALYGAIWYRFLFGVGAFDRVQILALYRDVLQPAG